MYEKDDYLVLQGCGGNLNEWVDGITNMFIENNIAKKDFMFKEIYCFENKGLTNMVFPLNDLDVGRLAIFRFKILDFGAMWLSDYVDNYLNKDGINI